MRPGTITSRDLRQIFGFVAQEIAGQEPYLNSLDAAIGDGDHGITMRAGFNAVNSRISNLPEATAIDGLLQQAGIAFLGATGGAIGVLFGRMLMAGGAALKGSEEIGPAEFRDLLSSMQTALTNAGKAKPGDKSLLDAVDAANQSVSGSAEQQGLTAMVVLAAEAAQRAAHNTAQMPARVGRSSRLGERALGHADPGAVSFSIVLGAIAQWLRSRSEFIA